MRKYGEPDRSNSCRLLQPRFRIEYKILSVTPGKQKSLHLETKHEINAKKDKMLRINAEGKISEMLN